MNKAGPNWIFFFFTAKLNYLADQMKGGRLWKVRGLIKKIKKEKYKLPICLKCKSTKASFSPNSIPNYSVILFVLFTTIHLIIVFNTNALGSRKEGFLRDLAAVEVIWTREADQL